MVELNFAKKQINPLIEKYSIDVENDKMFHKLILMFNEQTNYQVWAIKCVYGNICSSTVIEKVKEWLDNNKTYIQKLKKQNIVSYKTATDIKNLLKEMNGIDNIRIIKNGINLFNTEQREILTENILDCIDGNEDASSSPIVKSYVDLFKQVDKLTIHRKEKMISLASAIPNFDNLISYIQSSLSETYIWEKDDMISYMERNASDCTIVHNNGDIVVLNVPSFKSSKALCGGGLTGWCLTREESYFNRYVNDDAKQYFLFDFSKKEDDILSHVGFTVNNNSGVITNAHATNNESIIDCGIVVDNVKTNIFNVLENCGVQYKSFIPIYRNVNYDWEIKDFLKFLKDNSKECGICFNKDNRIILRPLSVNFYKLLVENTKLNTSNLLEFIDNSYKIPTYIMFDFNLEYNDDNAIIAIMMIKDRYNTMSINKITNSYNAVKSIDFLNNIGITINDFYNCEEIDAEILLHKYIDENREDDAIKLIARKGKNIDVNYEFNFEAPIFKTIHKKQNKLFNVIFNHCNFDIHTCDEFGENFLMCLMLMYVNEKSSGNETIEIENMINTILANKSFDVNKQDINDDTALHIACMFTDLNWVVSKLVGNKKANVNIVNDWMLTPLGNAITIENIEAIRLLGKRKDLIIRQEDLAAARDKNINLDQIINKTRKIKKEQEVLSETLINDLSRLFAEAIVAN